MRNEVIFDSRGVPDIMVTFTPDELGLPSELRGKTVKEYLISKYPNTLIDGVPYSLPLQKPATDVNHDEAIALCQSKGPGWHLLTNDEWVALARQSWENDTTPTGNTGGGHSHSHPEQTGTTYDGSGRTLAGSGPIQWNHDRTAEGVADLVGNVWEHVGGLRFLNGQVQVVPDNGAAAGADQSKGSLEWQAIYTAEGDPIYYNPKDGSLRLEALASDEKDYDGAPFTDLEEIDLDVPDKLIELGLYPPQGYEGTDHFWVDNDGESCVYRGGSWSDGADAGLFYLNGSNARSALGTGLGFRSAFIRYHSDLDKPEKVTDLSDAPVEIKEQIIENDQKLQKAAEEPTNKTEGQYETLQGLVRDIIAGQLAKLCHYTESAQIHKIAMKVFEADDTEFRELVQLLPTLAQIVAVTDSYEAISKQIKLAATTSIAIKEVPKDE